MTAGLEIRRAVIRVRVRHSQDDLHNKSGRGFAAAANEKGHHLRVIRKSRGLRLCRRVLGAVGRWKKSVGSWQRATTGDNVSNLSHFRE